MFEVIRENDCGFGFGGDVAIYRNGRYVATRFADGTWLRTNERYAPCELTRAQGYRYWNKYFAGRLYENLPQPLKHGIDMPPKTQVVKGDICYQG